MREFRQIYEANKDMVYNLALQYCQNASDAEEITQDVFVNVHQKLDSFKNKSSHSTWIYRITINKSLDFLKAKKAVKRSGIIRSIDETKEGQENIALPDFDHPGVLLEQKESLKNLFAKINTLPDNQKTVVILLKIEQKSQAEVAEIMNMKIKAVESLFYRAKKSLLKKLKENEG